MNIRQIFVAPPGLIQTQWLKLSSKTENSFFQELKWKNANDGFWIIESKNHIVTTKNLQIKHWKARKMGKSQFFVPKINEICIQWMPLQQPSSFWNFELVPHWLKGVYAITTWFNPIGEVLRRLTDNKSISERTFDASAHQFCYKDNTSQQQSFAFLMEVT